MCLVMVFYMAHVAYRPFRPAQNHRRLFVMSIVQAITTCVRYKGERRWGEKKGCERDRGLGERKRGRGDIRETISGG